MADGDENDFQRTLHEDWGRIDARVSAQGQAISNIARELAESRRDTGTRLDTIQSNIGKIASDLSAEIGKVNVSALAARSTNWTAVIGASAGVLTVVVSIILGFGAAVISPINANISRLEGTVEKMNDATQASLKGLIDTAVRRDDYKFDRRENESLMETMRKTERTDADKNGALFKDVYEQIGRLDERTKLQQAASDAAAHALGDRLTRAENHTDAVDAAEVRRPEIVSANEAITQQVLSGDRSTNARIDAITARMNTMQDQLSISPQKSIDQMWGAIRDLQARDSGKEGARQ